MLANATSADLVGPSRVFSPSYLLDASVEDVDGKHLSPARMTHRGAQGTESQMLGLLIVPCEKLAPWVDRDITFEN